MAQIVKVDGFYAGWKYEFVHVVCYGETHKVQPPFIDKGKWFGGLGDLEHGAKYWYMERLNPSDRNLPS